MHVLKKDFCFIPNSTFLYHFIHFSPDHYVPADDQPIGSVLITIEESSLFQAAYPEIVILYQMEQLEISNRNKKGKFETSSFVLFFFSPLNICFLTTECSCYFAELPIVLQRFMHLIFASPYLLKLSEPS